MNANALLLSDFQRAFAAALFEPGGQGARTVSDPTGSPIASLLRQPAFAIYRNSVRKACIDALEANYPAVAKLVGSDWFRASAAVYVADAPPRDARLMHYGADFAGFLARFEPAMALEYLPGVARLDRFWTEAHIAADAEALDGAALATLTPEQLGTAVLTPHPAARWAWFDEAPIHAIWRRNREDDGDTADIAWRSDGALLTRPQDSVQWCELSRADVAFLDACAAGRPLAAAAAAALGAEPDADLSRLIAKLLRAGAFAGLHGR